MLSLIDKKKRGQKLSQAEIEGFVREITVGQAPDYQISAFLMAVWFAGLDEEETYALTMAMTASGETLDLSACGRTIDKHSTGGIGDKLSLISLPLWAAAGLTVAKMSGRGLGFTGGTVDKLESVPGFNVGLSAQEFLAQAAERRFVITGQSADLAPADKILYSLRSVTATVDSIPLIAASIMSKKLAVRADYLVLDVKYGCGSFMKDFAQAETLARTMLDIAERAGQRAAALLSPMDQPLGYAVGNALEVAEAYRLLGGEGSSNLREQGLLLAALGFYLVNDDGNIHRARAEAEKYLVSGGGIIALTRLLKGQGGHIIDGDVLGVLPQAATQTAFTACADGVVAAIDAREIGLCAMLSGAGRRRLDDVIDYGAGVYLQVEVGDTVKCGDTLAVVHGHCTEDVLRRLQAAFTIKEAAMIAKPRVAAIIAGQLHELS